MSQIQRFLICLAMAALIWLFPLPCLAQNTADEELTNRIQELQSELNLMRKGEGAPENYLELRRIEDRRNEVYIKRQEELNENQERLNEIRELPEVRDWLDRIQKKQQELSNLYNERQKALQERALQLHEQRKTELAAIAAPNTPKARALGFTPLDYPRVDGSTSAQPLGVIVACRILGIPYRWAPTSRYSGKWNVGEKEIDAADLLPLESGYHPGMVSMFAPMGSNLSHEFWLTGYRPVANPETEDDLGGDRTATVVNRMLTLHAGTHGAYENVINGVADVGLVARRPSPDENDLAKEKGVELEVAPVALDAFVFIANYRNPVTNLSTAQIRDIYTEKIVNWKEVGGPDAAITPYRRERNSGSQELMETLVMKDLAFPELEGHRAKMLVQMGMGSPYIALTHDQRGLAYSVYYFEHFMSGSPETKLIAVDGVLPSFDTIRDRRYPYTTEVYIVTRKGMAANSAPAIFKAWLLSPEGQAVVRESGYVPLAGKGKK